MEKQNILPRKIVKFSNYVQDTINSFPKASITRSKKKSNFEGTLIKIIPKLDSLKKASNLPNNNVYKQNNFIKRFSQSLNFIENKEISNNTDLINKNIQFNNSKILLSPKEFEVRSELKEFNNLESNNPLNKRNINKVLNNYSVDIMSKSENFFNLNSYSLEVKNKVTNKKFKDGDQIRISTKFLTYILNSNFENHEDYLRYDENIIWKAGSDLSNKIDQFNLSLLIEKKINHSNILNNNIKNNGIHNQKNGKSFFKNEERIENFSYEPINIKLNNLSKLRMKSIKKYSELNKNIGFFYSP